MPRPARRLGLLIAAVSTLLIAAVTLIPHPEAADRAAATPLTCIACGELGGVDLLLNFLLFVPLGLGLSLAGFSWRRAVVLAALLTSVIELLQLEVISGRDASLGDLLANTGGGAIGAFLGRHWRAWLLPGRPASRRLALAWALALGWTWVGSAWAFGPTWPTGSPWYGQWAPRLGHLKPFLGRPLFITAGGEPLLPGPALDQARLEDAVAADPTMAFRAILGPPTVGLASVGSIYDGAQREVLLLGQDGEDLAYRVRLRATILRLRNPYAILPGGLTGDAGDTVDAVGTLRDGALELRTRRDSHVAFRRVPISASFGWALFAPWDARFDENTTRLTVIWITGLVAMLAYWSLRAGGVAVVLVPGTLAFLLAGVPGLAGLPPVPASEWLAAGIGAVVGGLAARAVRGSSTGLPAPIGTPDSDGLEANL